MSEIIVKSMVMLDKVDSTHIYQQTHSILALRIRNYQAQPPSQPALLHANNSSIQTPTKHTFARQLATSTRRKSAMFSDDIPLHPFRWLHGTKSLLKRVPGLVPAPLTLKLPHQPLPSPFALADLIRICIDKNSL